jgi:FkbM family methyltransferase
MNDLESFLSDVTGVVHVGANIGQESLLYASYDLDVVWIEPLPSAFEQLLVNTKDFPKQHCFKYLVTDKDNKVYQFYVASNGGCSSSIYDIADHRYLWPDVSMSYVTQMTSVTLTTLFKRENIDAKKHRGLILDTQGSELLVLYGAIPLLNDFLYIKIEVADFNAYEGCCQLKDIQRFMYWYGFAEHVKYEMPSYGYHPAGGHYWDIVYKRR